MVTLFIAGPVTDQNTHKKELIRQNVFQWYETKQCANGSCSIPGIVCYISGRDLLRAVGTYPKALWPQLWAKSTTTGYIRAGNKCQSIFYLFRTKVMKPRNPSKSTKLVSIQIWDIQTSNTHFRRNTWSGITLGWCWKLTPFSQKGGLVKKGVPLFNH